MLVSCIDKLYKVLVLVNNIYIKFHRVHEKYEVDSQQITLIQNKESWNLY